jgi:transcription termination/antitermination protein NusA
MDDNPNRRRRRAGEGRDSEPSKSLGSILEQVANEKGIAKKILVESFEAAILKAAQSAFGPTRNLEARFNEETGEIDLHQFVTVVEVVNEPEREVSLDAVEKDGNLRDATLGDEFGIQVFWRPEDATQALAQDREFGNVMPRIRDADREIIYNEYKNRKAELLPPPEKPSRKRQRAG